MENGMFGSRDAQCEKCLTIYRAGERHECVKTNTPGGASKKAKVEVEVEVEEEEKSEVSDEGDDQTDTEDQMVDGNEEGAGAKKEEEAAPKRTRKTK